jgi:hypothetical protein
LTREKLEMTIRPLLTLALAAGVFVARTPASARDPASDPPDPDAARDEIVRRQVDLARKFSDFRAGVLRRAQRLERAAGPDDRTRVAALRKAIRLSADEGLDTGLARVSAALKDARPVGPSDANRALEHARSLPEKLRNLAIDLAADPHDAATLLNVRCEYLLRTQCEIRDGILLLDKSVAANPGKKPSKSDARAVRLLSDRAGELDDEAGRLAGLSEETPATKTHSAALRSVGEAARTLRRRLDAADAGAASLLLVEGIGTKLQKVAAATRSRGPRKRPRPKAVPTSPG